MVRIEVVAPQVSWHGCAQAGAEPVTKVKRWTLSLIDFEGKIPIVKWVMTGVAYSVLSEVSSSIRRGDQQVQKDRDISARNI